nr:PREDICTED: erythropoietin receptor [Latimeria chalumnae]|eukprot:XP_005994190.2 PREDICTED: erythropoietin receptor [Latimeria chalumnae]
MQADNKNQIFTLCGILLLLLARCLQSEKGETSNRADVLSESNNPKCFTQLLEDLVCYWDQKESLKMLLDPPLNVTVWQTGKVGQLYVKWALQKVRGIGYSIRYKVSYAAAGSGIQQIEITEGRTECLLRNLKPQTEYMVRVRAKADGNTYSGYWSVWSNPVSAVTPTDFDPLILSLSLILVLILLVLAVIMIITHRRLMLKKVWPVIPGPESHFEGLFTVCKGNFQEWLKQSNSYFLWNPHFFCVEGLVTSVEAVSKYKPAVSHLSMKVDRKLLLQELPFFLSSSGDFMEKQNNDLPLEFNAVLESKGAYVVLSENFVPSGTPFRSAVHGYEGSSTDVSEEQIPLQTLFHSSHSSISTESPFSEEEPDSPPQSSMSMSGSGEPSHRKSTSSFDYAVYDPNGEVLYPGTWIPGCTPKYGYLMLSDSGISSNFSIMDSDSSVDSYREGFYKNLYRNNIYHGNPHAQVMYSQC